MKKFLLTLLLFVAALSVKAYDYPYLVFQTTDGTVTAVSVESLSVTISNGQLVATNSDGTKTFTLTELSKMYFSTDGNSDIKVIANSQLKDDYEVYDLQGRKISSDEMKSGIYVIKTKDGSQKVNVK